MSIGRRERMFSFNEVRVLAVVLNTPDISALRFEKFTRLCAERFPKPAEGARDSRLGKAAATIIDLCRGRDAPFRETDGVIHFLMSRA